MGPGPGRGDRALQPVQEGSPLLPQDGSGEAAFCLGVSGPFSASLCLSAVPLSFVNPPKTAVGGAPISDFSSAGGIGFNGAHT